MRESMRRCFIKWIGALLTVLIAMNLLVLTGGFSVLAAPPEETNESGSSCNCGWKGHSMLHVPTLEEMGGEASVDAAKPSTEGIAAVENFQGPTGERILLHGNKQLADEDAVVVVLTGDGYTRDNMDKFKQKAKEAKDGLLSQNVWTEVKDSLKIYMAPVVSRESGISGDNATSQAGLKDDQKDTWFKTHYWGGDRKSWTGWKNTWRFNEIKRDYDADTVVVLMNSDSYGGVALSSNTAITSGPRMVDTLIHELGHAVGVLPDEYYSTDMTPGVNVTRESDPNKIKWFRFIGKGDTGVVHAGQTPTGVDWYIPTNTCIMKASNNKDFCEICKDQMQKRLSIKTRISQLYFQTYGDIFIEGNVPDMKSYFILRDNGEEISGDQLEDKLIVTYYDSSGNELLAAPDRAGRYKVKGEFIGTAPYESCTLQGGEYEIKKSLDERTLKSIEPAALPNKTVYTKGEAFDAKGLLVSAVYAGNYKKVLGENDFQLTGADTGTAGEKAVTVTYKNKEVKFTIQVLDTTSTIVDGIRVNSIDATQISYGKEDWYVVGYNGAGAASEADKLTLFSKKLVRGWRPAFSEENINQYKDSGPYNYANLYERTYITSQERAAIARRNLTVCDRIDSQGTHTLHEDCDGIAGEAANDVGFWSLSKKEAEEVLQPLRGHATNWNYWLRTPGTNQKNVYTSCWRGIIEPDRRIAQAHMSNGLRLATHLKKESILVMTDSVNGKDSQSSSELKLMTAPTTKQKLTLIDQDLKSGAVRVYRKTPSSPSKAIRVDIQGATPGATVSAAIVNKEGKVVYYGRVGEIDSQGMGVVGTYGEIIIQLPVDISPKSGNKLKIFTEKVYGEGLTDYGSEPVEFSTIPNQPPIPLLTLVFYENIPDMTVGEPIEEIRLFGAAAGGKTPYRFTATGLPEGIAISTDGIISGTPTKAGGGGKATIILEDDSLGNTPVTRDINYGRIQGSVEPPKPEMPAASADYDNMKLTGLTPSATYNVTPAGSTLVEITTDDQGKMDIKKEWSNKEISIEKKDAQSLTQTLRIETIYSVSMDGQEVRISVAGKSITLQAPAKEGYRFKEWVVTGVDIGDTAKKEVTFIMPTGDVTLTTSYTKIEDSEPEGPTPEEPKPEDPKPEDPKPENPRPEQPPIVFPDVKQNEWFYGAVNYVTSMNIMSGYADGSFGPADKLGRAQFATTLYRLSGSPAVAHENIFPDVPAGQFYSVPAVWAGKNKIITGYANGGFGPSDTITREQLATMLYRYEIYVGGDVSQRADLNTFPDAGSVSSFSRDAMSWAVGKGLISGDQGNLNPQGESSRAVTATVIQRYETKK